MTLIQVLAAGLLLTICVSVQILQGIPLPSSPSIEEEIYDFSLINFENTAPWEDIEFNSTQTNIKAVIHKLNETVDMSQISMETVKSFQMRSLDVGYEYKAQYNGSSVAVSRINK